MFGLFKKKTPPPAQETAQPVQPEQAPEIRAFAAEFLPEETDIVAVTSPVMFDRAPVGEGGLWKISMGLTAWMDQYTNEIRQGEATLEAIVDIKLLDYLLERVPRNFIIAVTVRPDESGSRFMMTDLPKPGFDPDLKAILEAQKAPVTLETEDLGTFTLSRNLGWFENTVDWCGGEISLTFDQAEETRAAALETARALLADQQGWNERVRAYAADTLLHRANELLEQGEDALTREDFLAQLALDSMFAAPDGAFEFWFTGEDLFLLHPVHVSGNLTDGPVKAEMDPEGEETE